MRRPAEIRSVPCVSVTETLAALTRKTAMEMAGAHRDSDPALVRDNATNATQ
jgi:hypothetical protein